MSKTKINIPSYINEASYRYTMPRMDLKQESKGNGIKTNIWNLEDVARALRVPPEAIIKYLCAELGASKEKKSIIKGNHTYESLIAHLDKFIEKYLLCKKCKYPETTMYVGEGRQLMSRCRACSNKNSLDSIHKAGAFLIKELPKAKDLQEDIHIDVGEEDKKEEGKEEEDVEDGAEAQLALDSDELMERLDKISLMAQNKKENKDFIEEINNLQISLNLPSEYKYYILMFGLFNIGRPPLKNFKKNEAIFKHYLKKDGDLGTKHFLQSIVLFYIRRFPDLQKEANSIMQYLVGQKYFKKDFLLQWNAKKAKLDKTCVLYDRKAEKKFKGVIEKFLEFLDNESSSESDSSSDDEGEEEEKKQGSPKKEETEQQRKKREYDEMIKKQQEEQARIAKEMQQKAAEEEKATKKQGQEEQKEEGKVDITKVEVAEDFDVDDI